VHGGVEAAGDFRRDLFVLDLNEGPPRWTNTLETYNGPLDRLYHAAAWDPVRDRALFQGGSPDDNRTLRDTRALVVLGGVATPTPSATTGSSPTATSSPSATSTFVSVTPTATSTAGTSTATTTDPAPTDASPTASATASATGTTPPAPTTAVPTPSPTGPPVAAEVEIANYAFVPDPITIAVGETVRWVNRDDVPHTTTSGLPGAPDDVWDSDFLYQGEAFAHTFTAAGRYPYYCKVHPSMLGTVIVTGGSGGREHVYLPRVVKP
jgi:plastocyanin